MEIGSHGVALRVIVMWRYGDLDVRRHAAGVVTWRFGGMENGDLDVRRHAAGVVTWRYGGLEMYCRCSDVEL